MFDVYGNHVKEDSEILLAMDGFCLQDKAPYIRKVGIAAELALVLYY